MCTLADFTYTHTHTHTHTHTRARARARTHARTHTKSGDRLVSCWILTSCPPHKPQTLSSRDCLTGNSYWRNTWRTGTFTPAVNFSRFLARIGVILLTITAQTPYNIAPKGVCSGDATLFWRVQKTIALDPSVISCLWYLSTPLPPITHSRILVKRSGSFKNLSFRNDSYYYYYQITNNDNKKLAYDHSFLRSTCRWKHNWHLKTLFALFVLLCLFLLLLSVFLLSVGQTARFAPLLLVHLFCKPCTIF